MGLTTYSFPGFFALMIILYYIVPKKVQWLSLLFGSYGFYFLYGAMSGKKYSVSGGLTLVMLLFAVTFVTYMTAILVERTEKHKKAVLTIGLLAALAILGVFKYADFVIDNINLIAGAKEGEGIKPLNLILPLGISFYSFQSIGYLMDVYWEKIPAEKNLLKHMLFVSFFPQLIQGPISRHSQIAQELYASHGFSFARLSSGLERVLWGYFKKLVVADNLAPAALGILGDEKYDGAWVLVGLVLYSIELYADFSGGIDIAIGAAECFGVKLPENFDRPYFSISLADYWRRWHITMGTWFKDYVFFPVSTSKALNKLGIFCKKKFGRKAAKTIRVWIVTMIVWLATGIWHGASWNFIVWGVGNGLVLLISGELKPLYDRFNARFPKLTGSKGYLVFRILRTFFVANSLTLLDVYRNVPMAFRMYISMFTRFSASAVVNEGFAQFGVSGGTWIVIGVSCAAMLIVSLLKGKGDVRTQLLGKPYAVRAVVYGALFFAVILFGAYGVGYDASSFIYNQF